MKICELPREQSQPSLGSISNLPRLVYDGISFHQDGIVAICKLSDLFLHVSRRKGAGISRLGCVYSGSALSRWYVKRLFVLSRSEPFTPRLFSRFTPLLPNYCKSDFSLLMWNGLHDATGVECKNCRRRRILKGRMSLHILLVEKAMVTYEVVYCNVLLCSTADG